MKLKIPVKKRFFTLLELIVVLIVISLISGVFTLNIRDLWRQQAFLDESSLLLNQLRLAQDMMQIMDSDVEVRFKANDGIHTVKILEVGLPTILGQSIADHSALTFKAIGPLFFEDINGTVLEDEFVLTFFSRGFAMNHGVLKFGQGGAKSATLAIALPGYPQPLAVQPIDAYTLPSLNEKSQLERLTDATRQEINYEKENEPEEETPKSNDKDQKK